MSNLGDPDSLDRARLLEQAHRLVEGGQFSAVLPLLRNPSLAEDDWAAVMLGWMYMTGHGVVEDRDEAARCFHQAASRNDEIGMFYLGRLLADRQDYGDAIDWFSRCGEKGFPPCQLWLGLAYLRGLGVPIDTRRGVRLLQAAAKAGNYPARRELAVLMMKGRLGITRIPTGCILFFYWLLIAVWSTVFGKSSAHAVG